jgi:outer membrane protein assembly factor BamB
MPEIGNDFTFEEFSTELEDFRLSKVGKFERLWKIGYGGSIDQRLLLHNGIICFGCCDHSVYAISAADGRLIWRFRTSGPIVESSPVLWNDTIYIGSYDQNLYAIDASTGEMRWKFRTQGEIGASACISNGIVYFGSRDQNAYAVRADDGSLVWKFRTMDEIMSTPAVWDGKVFIGSFDHILYCLDASSGALIWKFPALQEIYNANPFLIHRGVIYFGSFDNYLRAVAIDRPNGPKELWRFYLGAYATAASPVLHNNILYQETRDGSLIALTLDGKELWRFRTREAVAVPLVHEGRIYLGSADYNMYCLDMKGRILWKFPAQGYVWWEPVVWGNTLCFSSWDCHIYAVDKNTGKELWRFNTGSDPSYIPPISEGFLLEISRTMPEEESKEGRKRYDFNVTEEAQAGSFYKARITYQVSTQYREKGKYQTTDDDF